MYDPANHHRRSIRLKEYDYSAEGLYFVTLCSHEHQCIFGKIIDDNVILSKYGEIIEEVWRTLPQHFTNIVCHEYVIMPNHMHCIIQINNNVGAGSARPAKEQNTSPLQKITLGNIVAFYKYNTTKLANRNVQLWQRNYYEHIIRNQQSYEEIAAYIVENPIHWKRDKLYTE